MNDVISLLLVGRVLSDPNDNLEVSVPSRQLRSSSETVLNKCLLSKQSPQANALLHIKVLQSGKNSRTTSGMHLSKLL